MRNIILLMIALFSIVPLAASAQTDASCSVSSLPITMSVTGDLDSTVPSTSVGFHATINNAGSVTIPDAALVIDVVRMDEAGNDTIVDRFIAPQHVTIFGHYSGTTDFAWKVPQNLSTGTYSLVVTLAPKDAPISQVFAHISYPTAKQNISIKDGSPFAASIRVVAVNGQNYKPLSVAQISGGGSATATIHNGSAAPYKGTLTWRLYSTDARIDAVPIDEKTETVELHPNTDTQVAYSISNSDNHAYYLEGELNNGQETTYFDILLDNGSGAFPWTACIAGTGTLMHSTNTNRAIAAILILLVIIGAWLAERRRFSEMRGR